MRSLYGYEQDLSRITEMPDEEITRIAVELGHIASETEIPRQRQEAQRLLGHIVFEVGQRLGTDI